MPHSEPHLSEQLSSELESIRLYFLALIYKQAGNNNASEMFTDTILSSASKLLAQSEQTTPRLFKISAQLTRTVLPALLMYGMAFNYFLSSRIVTDEMRKSQNWFFVGSTRQLWSSGSHGIFGVGGRSSPMITFINIKHGRPICTACFI